MKRGIKQQRAIASALLQSQVRWGCSIRLKCSSVRWNKGQYLFTQHIINLFCSLSQGMIEANTAVIFKNSIWILRMKELPGDILAKMK